MLFGANEKYILFKYARYILKPDKLKHKGPIGFGYDPEKKQNPISCKKRKTLFGWYHPFTFKCQLEEVNIYGS